MKYTNVPGKWVELRDDEGGLYAVDLMIETGMRLASIDVGCDRFSVRLSKPNGCYGVTQTKPKDYPTLAKAKRAVAQHLKGCR